ncbi:MAG: thiamine phosphate synthase [Clostridia bacterium]|nr:thiamine phosphate synthase [Lachnospiraceae bacterium]NCC01791.1 thiamine phosphate synthase [Clostridia bacterium]NCD03003.1 thiamine phosphate synthase [Clostridia bacterium]
MIYAVTNRNLVEGGEPVFLKQIEKIAAARPDGIILREKDLQPLDYELLAKKCQVLCNAYETPLIINHFHEVSQKIFNRRIHLSMAVFKELAQRPEGIGKWKCLGVSVHSREEALYAEEIGADYVIAGHIFLTDCKKGLAARGLDFLKEICDSVNIPVFAIGGMDLVHGPMALEAGAAGICMMSELMKSTCPEEIIKRFSGRSL